MFKASFIAKKLLYLARQPYGITPQFMHPLSA
jgi:hypothetical protein